MEAKTLIDSYVDDIARRLPRTSRDDVALELRTLLTEQLDEAAANAGRAADRELALAVLRRFGRTEEVASRYLPEGVSIVEPKLATAFLKSAAACIAIQWALTLPNVFFSPLTFQEWLLGWGIGAFSWVGVLVAWFAAAAWVRRRSPVDPDSFSRPWTHGIFWLPFVEDWRPERVPQPRVEGAVDARRPFPLLLVLAAALITFFVSPAWFLEWLLPVGTDISWAQYADGFRRELLWPLITLAAVRLVLSAAVYVNGSWARPTEGIRFALWICFVGALAWTVFGWTILASAQADVAFKAWLLIFLTINTIQIVAHIRRAIMRVLAPEDLTPRDLVPDALAPRDLVPKSRREQVEV
jgi:hypothetical protein